MSSRSPSVSSITSDVRLRHRQSGQVFEGSLHVGGGVAVLESAAQATGRSGLSMIEEVVKGLLVQKGVDWTGTILNEYLGLYRESRGVFALVTEKKSGRLVAHASVFSSACHAGAGLLAHVRAAQGWGGYGLGTLVTEAVTGAALAAGVPFVVLETDDRLFRTKQGERAAYGMYERIGYAVLRERRGADSTGWIMVINARIFSLGQKLNSAAASIEKARAQLRREQARLVAALRAQFSSPAGKLEVDQVRAGDLGGLFLLLNLHPPQDFTGRLVPWRVFDGPECEREFVVRIRPALAAGNPPEDGSVVLRDSRLGIVAICAVRRVPTRSAYEVDFYCVPGLLRRRRALVRELVRSVRQRFATDAVGAQLVAARVPDRRKALVLAAALRGARRVPKS